MEIFDLSDTCCPSADIVFREGRGKDRRPGSTGGRGKYRSRFEEDDAAEKETKEPEPEILHFVDVYQNPHQVEISPKRQKHDYKDDSFVHNGDRLSYEDDSNYHLPAGCGRLEHRGYVDWQALKTADLDLPLSIWLPGYGQEGRESAWTRNFTGISRMRRPPGLMGVYFLPRL